LIAFSFYICDVSVLLVLLRESFLLHDSFLLCDSFL
jgi:hypothetical protein